jgi:hypothetical protein
MPFPSGLRLFDKTRSDELLIELQIKNKKEYD